MAKIAGLVAICLGGVVVLAIELDPVFGTGILLWMAGCAAYATLLFRRGR